MKNRDFYWELRKLKAPDGSRLTVGKIAAAIYCNRAHLGEAINHKPGRGSQTRRKMAAYLLRAHPGQAAQLLKTLGWNELGEIIPVASNRST